jgi:16S rRNA (uracil1498-N3)-methyltransferase
VRVPRFYVPEAGPGVRASLPDSSSHHARDVLRLRAGDSVRVFDGRGSEYDAIVAQVTRREVELHIAGAVSVRSESLLPIRLAISPLKGDLMELVIQKATELGIASLHPVIMLRTDPVARRAVEGTRQKRWEKVAASAAEQCGRATVPEIAPTTRLVELDRLTSDLRIVCLLGEDAPPMTALPPPASGVTVVVGPAGGLDPSEIEVLTTSGCRPASLGPRVLRAETAAITAVVASQLLWGDLGR